MTERPEDGDLESDAIKPHDVNDIFDEVVQRRKNQDDTAERLRDMHKRNELEFRDRSDVHVELVKDPAIAEDLAQRHKQLNQAGRIAQTLYDAIRGGHKRIISALADDVSREGAFLQDEGYGVEEMRQRILDPNFVITRAGGVITDREEVLPRPFRFVSDMQVQLPPDDAELPISYVPPPRKRSAFYDYKKSEAIEIARRISRDPSIAGLIADVGVYPPEYKHKGFASLARQFAFRHIRDVVNTDPGRRTPIQYVLANMFLIKGVTVDGEQLTLDDAILNEVSLLMHVNSRRFHSVFAWRTPGKPIGAHITNAEGESREAQLDVDWETVVMSVKPKE